MARAFWLLVTPLLLAVVVAIPVAARARFEGLWVPSASMVPALLPGDYILVDKSVREAARGDLIIFSDPAAGRQLLVKRVIGVGGDRITIRGPAVYLNCWPSRPECPALAEPYAYYDGVPGDSDRTRTWEVPTGAYFVMADNRNRGEDSRQWGPIPWERITGRPLLIYWSRDPEAGTLRWERLGLRIR